MKSFKQPRPIQIKIFRDSFERLERYKSDTKDEAESFRTAVSAINTRFRPDAAKQEISKERTGHNIRKIQLADAAVSEIKDMIDSDRQFLKTQVRPTQADIQRLSELKTLSSALPLSQAEFDSICAMYGSKSYIVDRALQRIGSDAKLETKPCAAIDSKLSALDELEEIATLYIRGTEEGRTYHNPYVSEKPGISYPPHDADVAQRDSDIVPELMTSRVSFNRLENIYTNGTSAALTPDSFAEQVAGQLSSIKSHGDRVKVLKKSAEGLPGEYKDALIERLSTTQAGELILDEADVASLEELDAHKKAQADTATADAPTAGTTVGTRAQAGV